MVCAAFFLVQRMLAPNAVLQRSKSSKLVTQCLLQTDWTVVRVPYTEFRECATPKAQTEYINTLISKVVPQGVLQRASTSP
eukprot:m.264180 g.264180  ORF g.264180 m.264180 type:complete len:81 (-) comp15610_c1_seq7:541-783(-)